MIKFGPAGNSESFYGEGHKHTYEQMAWLCGRGLNAYEYSFGRGVRVSAGAAHRIAVEAEANCITVSCHAPYYINLAVDTEDRMAANDGYIFESCEAAAAMGAQRIVIHPGSCAKIDRSDAARMVTHGLGRALDGCARRGYTQTLCIETMGKVNQFGSLREVIDLCATFETVLPVIDFGHLYARTLGGIAGRDDYLRIIDAMQEGMGERTNRMHVHFSKIEYTGMGEKKHLTFDDPGFGPDFRPLMEIFAQRAMQPTVICESKGTMAEDALTMKNYYEECLAK